MQSVPEVRWEDLSPSSRAAFGFAVGCFVPPGHAEESAAPPLPKVTSRSLLVGVLESHAGKELDDPAGELLTHFDVSRADLNAELERVWVEQASRFDPSISREVRLDGFPPLSASVVQALAHASRLWQTLGPDQRPVIPLRFLFGGLLNVPDSGAYRTLDAVIEEVELATIAAVYARFLGAGKDASLATFLEEIAPHRDLPTSTASPTSRTASYAAGTTSDRALGHDVLGRGELAHHIARWVAAKNLQTPLAVGLFGVWGSGKSFFMGDVQSRIRTLTGRSARVAQGTGRTDFCTNIAQVNFNAWFHSGSDLWPSLATQVFRTVGGVDPNAVDPAAGAKRRGEVAKSDPAVAKVQDELNEAVMQEAAATRTVRDLGGQIPQLEQAVATKGARVETGRSPSLARRIVVGWRRLHRMTRWSLVVVLIGLLVALILGLTSDEILKSVVATLALVATGAGFVARSLAYTRDFIKADRELSAKEAARTDAQARVIEARKLRIEKESELQQLATGSLVSAYASVQATRWELEERRDVVAEIRRAFEGLSERIEAVKTGSSGDVLGATVDRVIVYIDDLDRCEADVVVHVLETIKLLMDLPNFVVFVGVDSRWLARAIETHFEALIGRDRDQLQRRHTAEWASMPQDYLEKIFQFSLVLPRMSQQGYENLVGSLLEVPRAFTQPGPASTEPQDVTVEAQVGEPPVTDGEAAEGTDVGDGGDAPSSDASRSSDASDEDLQPSDLVITVQEKTLMKALGSLIETPRSAKRLTNVYRLFRVIEGEDRLLRDKAFEPVLLLFGLLIGFPRQAGDLLTAVADQPSQDDWETFTQRLKPERKGDAFLNVALELVPAVEIPTWTRMSECLGLLQSRFPPTGKLERFQAWVPYVASYTFHPWQETPLRTTH
jgi:KAP family P-loop domain